MRIPSAKARAIRSYQNALFHSKTESESERVYAFYLLLSPLLGWLEKGLLNLGLEEWEVRSEIYIYCSILFFKFDPQKSSIIPYLERAIPWEAGKFLREKRKTLLKEEPYGLINLEDKPYEMFEESWFYADNALFCDKYIGKHFTLGQKYLIYIILLSDLDGLSCKKIASKCKTDRKTIKTYFDNIKQVLKDGGYDGK